MKKMILTAITLILSVSSASLATAQDDIYYSKSNASKKTIYAETSNDVWSTDANDDWDIDAYNRRGSAYLTDVNDDDKLTIQDTKVIHDTIVVPVTEVKILDPFYWSHRIHRFHNHLFGFWAYSPYYYNALYDGYYWDWGYNIYSPWWYSDFAWGWDPFYYGWGYNYYDYGYYS